MQTEAFLTKQEALQAITDKWASERPGQIAAFMAINPCEMVSAALAERHLYQARGDEADVV
jgi:hypothetical protein